MTARDDLGRDHNVVVFGAPNRHHIFGQGVDARFFTRDGDETPVFNQAVATNVFSAGAGSTGWAVNGNGDFVVFRVTDITPPTTEASKDIVDFVTNAIRDGLYQDLIVGLTDEMWPTSARGAAYQRMLTLLTTTTAQ